MPLFVATIGAAQEVVRFEAVRQPAIVVSEQQFNSWAFGNAGDADAVRKGLEDQLEARVNDIERYCVLSSEQADRLRLAGRGDVERFFSRVDQKRDEMQGKSFDQEEFNEIFQGLRAIQQEYQAGLFGDDALLSKVAASVLDPEQSSRLEEAFRGREAFRFRSSVDTFISQAGVMLGLTEDQRARFAEAVEQGIQPPRRFSWNSPYQQFLVAYLVSEVPEEAIRPIFDDAQWRVLRAHFDQAERFVPAMRAQGLIEDEDGREE